MHVHTVEERLLVFHGCLIRVTRRPGKKVPEARTRG